MITAYEIGEQLRSRSRYLRFVEFRTSHEAAIRPLIEERVRIRSLYSWPIMVLPDIVVESGWQNESAREFDSFLGKMIEEHAKDFVQKCNSYFPDFAYRADGIMVDEIPE